MMGTLVVKRLNPARGNGQQSQSHICCSTVHFARNCSPKSNYNLGNLRNPVNESYVAAVNLNTIEYDISNTKFSHTFNYIILGTRFPRIVAGKVWFELFIYRHIRHVTLVKGVFKSLFYVEMPILLAGRSFLIQFDVVDSDLFSLLGKNERVKFNY